MNMIWSTRGKTSHGRVENQQTQSTYDAECGNQTQATLVEGKCSSHEANPVTIKTPDSRPPHHMMLMLTPSLQRI